jgi:hypothetical protein
MDMSDEGTKVQVDGVEVIVKPVKKEEKPKKKSSPNIIFLLLPLAIMAVCMLVSLGDSSLPEQDFESLEVSTPLTDGSIGCEPEIKVGGWVEVVANVRMRSNPGYRGEDDTIHFCQDSDRLLVLEGPREKDGLCWWRVRDESLASPVEGWMADHAQDGLRLLKPAE